MNNSFSEKRQYRPGIVASREKRAAIAYERSLPIQRVIKTMLGAGIPEIVAELRKAGYRASRGGPITYNTVLRAIARMGTAPPVVVRKQANKPTKDIRSRIERFEAFRTPNYSFTPLLDYSPEWFTGKGFDPSAGDGRMLREIVRRGNLGPHFANDIRPEELVNLESLGCATTADYLQMSRPPECDFMITNPPFSLAMEFVDKARMHVQGPICILQSIAWQSTKKRSEWLRNAGLAYVLNLPRRPRWEVDSGDRVGNNIWDFAWFVFLPNHTGRTIMDWLVE